MFNPYRKWLGIPEDEQPPTHYRLLGIASDEQDLDVINAAVVRQSAYVRNFQSGKYADDASRILTEIAAAKSCLLDRTKRAEYDADLRKQAAPPPPEEDLDLAPDPEFDHPKSGAKPAANRGQAAGAGQAPGKPGSQTNPGTGAGAGAAAPAVRPAAAGQSGGMVPAPRPGQQPARRAGSNSRGSAGPMDPLFNPRAPARIPSRGRTRTYTTAYRRPSPLARYWKPLVAGLSVGAVVLAVVFWNLGDDNVPLVTSSPNGSANGPNSTGSATNDGAKGNTGAKGPTKNSTGSTSSGSNSSGSNSTNGGAGNSGGEKTTNSSSNGGAATSASNGGSSNSSRPSSSDSENGGNESSTNSSNGGGDDSTGPAVEVATSKERTPAEWSSNEEGWAEALPLGLSFGGRGPGFVTFAPSGSPYAAVGDSVWNLEENVEVGKIQLRHENYEIAAVNQNGRIVAVNESFFNDGILIYNVGEPSSLPAGESEDRIRSLIDELSRKGGHAQWPSPYRDARVTYLQFAGLSTLVAAFTKGLESRIAVLDLVTNQPVGEFPCEPFDARNATVDPNGVYFACATRSAIRVIDMQKRKNASMLRVPKRDAKEGAKPLTEFTCQGLSFSPDGQMLAALVQGGKRLLVWNGKSELLLDHDLDMNFSATYVGPRLVWLPDGGGWILHGQHMIDRETRTVLWELKSQSADPFSDLRFVNQEFVVVQRAEVGGRTLTRVPVPWIKIAGAAQALRRNEPAYLAPGVAVGLAVTADKLRATEKSKVESEIERIVGNRLREGQFPLRRAEKGVVMKATYVETEGRPVRVGLKAGTPTVRGDLTLELVADGVDAPLWKAVLAAEAPLDSMGKPTSETLAIFDLLAGQLKSKSLPRYIPRDRSLANLPIVSEF